MSPPVHLLLNLDLNLWLAILVDNGEWEVLHVTLDIPVVELATNKTLDVEDCPERVGGKLVLGCARR